MQTRLHARWRQQKLAPFEHAPDLGHDIRPVLDRMTPELIATLKLLQPHLCEPAIQNLLARRSASVFNKEWDQATREKSLAPLYCH